MTDSDDHSVGENDDDVVNIDYIKSSIFRTIAPSGMIGSLTPQGKIQIAFFNERQAIPQRVVYRVNEDGSLGDVVDTVSRDAIVREMDIAITLDRDLAERLLSFVSDLIQEIKTTEEIKNQ